MMTEDEQPVVGVEFLVGAGRNLSHGDEQAALDAGGCVFPGLADVDEFGLASLKQGGGLLRLNFIAEHSRLDASRLKNDAKA